MKNKMVEIVIKKEQPKWNIYSNISKFNSII